MKRIDRKTLDRLTAEAEASARKRKNLNYHDKLSDTLQRLLNAMEPGTYVQPHKHENPDKREFFVILRGKAAAIIFDNDGAIKEHMILDNENENYGIEIPERTWHTIVILEKGTVLFEIKDGPYEPIDDKNFANWAPKENDPDCDVYLKRLIKKIGF